MHFRIWHHIHTPSRNTKSHVPTQHALNRVHLSQDETTVDLKTQVENKSNRFPGQCPLLSLVTALLSFGPPSPVDTAWIQHAVHQIKSYLTKYALKHDFIPLEGVTDGGKFLRNLGESPLN